MVELLFAGGAYELPISDATDVWILGISVHFLASFSRTYIRSKNNFSNFALVKVDIRYMPLPIISFLDPIPLWLDPSRRS